jgi:hypothetical protein
MGVGVRVRSWWGRAAAAGWHEVMMRWREVVMRCSTNVVEMPRLLSSHSSELRRPAAPVKLWPASPPARPRESP